MIKADTPPILPVPGTRFGSGQVSVGGGRPKGSKNRLALRISEQLEEHFDSTGPDSNPLIILATIAANVNEKSMIRVQAASALCRILIPRKLELSNESPDVKIHADKMIVMLGEMFGQGQTQKVIDAPTG